MLDPGALPRTNWDVNPVDGSFVFVSTPGAESGVEGGTPVVPLEVVVNWFEELKQRMGGN